MTSWLEPRDFERVRPLFAGLDFQLSAAAVLDGMNPGRVLVDDPAQPRCALICSPEGLYLAGDASHQPFHQAVSAAIFEGRIYDDPTIGHFFVVENDVWADRIPDIFAPRPPIVAERRHYVCTALALDWRSALPDGYSAYPIDAALLARPGLRTPDHLHGWIENNWGSREDFLARGFGAVTVDEAADAGANAVVSWSLADCVSGSGGEIGIHTDPAYRRRGLAAITAAAAVEQGFARGLTVVGWQCAEDNVGSYRTAERVGFTLERRYTAYYMYPSEVSHLAETGWLAFQAGRYRETADNYTRIFTLYADAPALWHILAAQAWARLDEPDQAMTSLAEAAARGWSDVAMVVKWCSEFEPLRALPDWESVVDRIRANAAADEA